MTDIEARHGSAGALPSVRGVWGPCRGPHLRKKARPTMPGNLRAVPTVQIDNDRVRVTEWRFAPGAATGWHRHEYDYTVVPMTTGPLAITGATGDTTASLVAGAPYFRQAGVEH